MARRLLAIVGAALVGSFFALSLPQAQDSDAALVATLMAEGAAAFPHTCAACHGPEGGGQVGPPLRNNTASTRGLVRVLQFGRGPMPPLGAEMSDREVAAVLTFIRNSWGNDYGPVLPSEIAPYRVSTYPVAPQASEPRP